MNQNNNEAAEMHYYIKMLKTCENIEKSNNSENATRMRKPDQNIERIQKLNVKSWKAFGTALKAAVTQH